MKRLTVVGIVLASVPTPAHAWMQAEMTDPGLTNPDFAAEVLAVSTQRAEDFLKFLGQGMIEQAFSLQHASPQTSATLKGPQGLEVGVTLDTFPLSGAVTNLIGKAENTKFIPVLPRFDVGWSGKKGDYDYRVGWSWVPPMSVQGASAQVVGIDTSIARPVNERLKLGLELDYSNGHAIAPVTATPEQYEAGQLPNVDPVRYEAICVPQEFGCLDTLTLRHGYARLAAAYQLSKMEPWMEVGVTHVWETFDVQVDLSSFRLTGFTPTAGVGLNLPLHDHLRTAVSTTVAYRPDSVSEEGAGLLYRLEGGVSWVF